MNYVTLKIHDNRICNRCGARQGKCSHTEGQVYHGELRTMFGEKGARRKEDRESWLPDTASTISHLYNANYTYDEIAERMNLSRGAVAGRIHRMKQAGEIVA